MNSGLFIQLDKIERQEKPIILKQDYRELEPVEEIYNALVLGTRDYIKKNAFTVPIKLPNAIQCFLI